MTTLWPLEVAERMAETYPYHAQPGAGHLNCFRAGMVWLSIDHPKHRSGGFFDPGEPLAEALSKLGVLCR